jgi:carbon-monoxide dehydrogenase medium subunit
MLLNLREYHRPAAMADPPAALRQALELLGRPGIHTVPLAGGSHLLASGDATVEAVVDLQGLRLDGIQYDARDGILHVGAMTTRAALAEDPHAQRLCSGLLSRAARRWSGSVQRNRATVGGAVVVAEPNDPLILALLAAAASVLLLDRTGTRSMALSGFLAARHEAWPDGHRRPAPELVSGIEVPISPGLRGGLAEVGRTPSDAPIVAACAVLDVTDGRCTRAGLALGGVAETALTSSETARILVGEPLTHEAIARAAALVARGVTPLGDHRGSTEYQRAMAETLSARALAQAAALAE